MNIQKFAEFSLLGNSLAAWAAALLLTLCAFAVMRVVRNTGLKKAESLFGRARSNWPLLIVHALGHTKNIIILIIGLYIGSLVMALPDETADILRAVSCAAAFVQVGIWLSYLTGGYISRYRQLQRKSNPGATTAAGALRLVLITVIWVFVFLLILDNFGVNITTLVAGLGIGGIAVALAVQNILGDLFGSLSIVIDRPFVEGDFIALGDISGNVENVGMKSTRIRSLSGEQIVIANSDLLAGRIRNYGRMYERRIQVNFQIGESTLPEHIEAIPNLLQSFISAQDKVRFDRAHFFKFSQNGLEFEYVYFVKTPDYNFYMDIQQKINMMLYQYLCKHDIDLNTPQKLILHAAAAARAEDMPSLPDGRPQPH